MHLPHPNMCDALRDLVPFVQFKKREVTIKVTLLLGCFSRILNGTNSTKLRNASHI